MFKFFRWLGSFLSGLTVLALVLGCVLLGVYFWLQGSDIGKQFEGIGVLGYVGGTLFTAGSVAGFAVAILYLLVFLLALFKKKRMVKYGGVLGWNIAAFILWALLAIVTFVSVYYSKLPSAVNANDIPGSNIFGAKPFENNAWQYVVINPNTMVGWLAPLAAFAVLSIVFAIIAGHAGSFTRDNYRTEAQVQAIKAKRGY